MQTLRRFTSLTRALLVWFVLSLGVAVASPIVKPQDILLVCSAFGAAKALVQNDDGSTSDLGASAMDCPLCMTAGAPPPVAVLQAVPAQPLAYALQSIPSAHIVARTAAPPPARGPPAL
jgi:hypothetical protein